MSRSGRIRTFFGDADHDFMIGVGGSEELDERFGLGLMQIQEAVTNLRVPVIAEVLRIGLVGAGGHPETSARLVSRYLVPGYFLDCGLVAAKVVEAAVRGVPDDMPGEAAGEGATPNPSPTAG